MFQIPPPVNLGTSDIDSDAEHSCNSSDAFSPRQEEEEAPQSVTRHSWASGEVDEESERLNFQFKNVVKQKNVVKKKNKDVVKKKKPVVRKKKVAEKNIDSLLKLISLSKHLKPNVKKPKRSVKKLKESYKKKKRNVKTKKRISKKICHPKFHPLINPLVSIRVTKTVQNPAPQAMEKLPV